MDNVKSVEIMKLIQIQTTRISQLVEINDKLSKKVCSLEDTVGRQQKLLEKLENRREYVPYSTTRIGR